MDKVKVALIGAGGMANRVHYPSVTSFDDVQIVGLCDLDAKRLGDTAKAFGIGATFGNYREMLDKTKPDAVYVLMPPHHLFDVAMDVLERGHALFIEKPPGITTQHAQCLAKRAADKKVISAVGFQRRYQPLVVKCWEQVKAKGPMQQVNACFYKNSPPSEVHPYYRGTIDVLRCDAIHAVDALRFYAGRSEVKAVRSSVSKIDCWYDVRFLALVEFKNNVVGVLQANWRTGRRFFKFEFHGIGAMAFVDINGEGAVYADNADQPVLRQTAAEAAATDKEHIEQGFYAENRAFIDAVKSGRPVHNDLADGAKSMELADMIYAAAATA